MMKCIEICATFEASANAQRISRLSMETMGLLHHSHRHPRAFVKFLLEHVEQLPESC